MFGYLRSIFGPSETASQETAAPAVAQPEPEGGPVAKPEVRRIPMMRLEVRSACQYDCEMCAHGHQRKRFKDYELSLEQLERFLNVTRESGYVIGNMRIHGPGEPLLWHHFNEGVRMLKASGVVESVFVASNGLLLHKIEEATWDSLDELRISVYSDFNRQKTLEECQGKYGDKISLSPMDNFVVLPKGIEDEAPIPCQCMCDGPMLLGDRLFYYCGPPVFGAGHIMGRDVMEDPKLSVPIERGYMENYDRSLLGNMDYCKFCWANEHFFSRTVPQSTTGGNWR